MKELILITGGAGSMVSHLANRLLREGYTVRLLDDLSEQAHGPDAVRPKYLDPELELIIGDVRDPAAVWDALDGVDAVFHSGSMGGAVKGIYPEARSGLMARGLAV